jgi:hypothetical protein
MRSIHTRAHIDEDGRLQLSVPANLPPGPVDVVIVFDSAPPAPRRSLRELRKLGAEVWEGIDPQEYISRLRAEWDD